MPRIKHQSISKWKLTDVKLPQIVQQNLVKILSWTSKHKERRFAKLWDCRLTPLNRRICNRTVWPSSQIYDSKISNNRLNLSKNKLSTNRNSKPKRSSQLPISSSLLQWLWGQCPEKQMRFHTLVADASKENRGCSIRSFGGLQSRPILSLSSWE